MTVSAPSNYPPIISERRIASTLGFATVGLAADQGMRRDTLAGALGLDAPTTARAPKLVSTARFVARTNHALDTKTIRNVAVSGLSVTWDGPDWTVPTRYLIETRTGTTDSDGWTTRSPVATGSYTAPNGTAQVRITPTTSAGNLGTSETVDVVGTPTLTIRIANSITTLAEDQTYDFNWQRTGGTATGDYSAPRWTATEGTITNAGVYTPPDVSVNTSVTVAFSVTRQGVTATASNTFTVTPVVPTLSVHIANKIQTLSESSTYDFNWQKLSGTATGAFSVTWSVVSGGGSISSSGVYTPPDVSSNRTVVVGLSVTQGGVTDTDTDTFTVTPVVPTLSVHIANKIQTLSESSTYDFNWQKLSGTATGAFSVTWSVVSGGGSISSSGVYTPPDVSSNRTVVVGLSVTQGGVTDTDTDTFTVTPVVEPPNASVTVGNITPEPFGDLSVGAARTVGCFNVRGNYDRLSYAWSVPDGSGSVSITPNGSGQTAGIHGLTAGTIRLRCTVTAHGDGTNAKTGTSDSDSDDTVFRVV